MLAAPFAVPASARPLPRQPGDSDFPIVRKGGVYLKGRRYRAVGCNFYDVLDHPDFAAHLALLKSLGVPFIRCNFGAFDVGTTPDIGWRTYFDNKENWYGLRDTLVAAAENIGIGIIPSFFWRLKTIPELMAFVRGGVPTASEWSDRASASRRFISQATSETVERYHKSSAIWGWEIGNEFSAIPIAEYRARMLSIAQSGKSYRKPTVTFDVLWDIYADWAAAVRSVDKSERLLSSGDMAANYNLYHCATQANTETDLDTFEQWMNIPFRRKKLPAPLLLNPPATFNSISAHIYQVANLPDLWFKGAGGRGAGALVHLYKRLSVECGKPLFIGEFGSLAGDLGQDGTSGTDRSEDGEKLYFEKLLQTIVAEQVDFSAVWNYGYLPVNKVKRWNIDPGTKREYMLEAIAAANANLRDKN
jgi:hypothetical protein